jgi:hypothetical protein
LFVKKPFWVDGSFIPTGSSNLKKNCGHADLLMVLFSVGFGEGQHRTKVNCDLQHKLLKVQYAEITLPFPGRKITNSLHREHIYIFLDLLSMSDRSITHISI